MFNHVKKIQLDDSDLVSYMYAFNLSGNKNIEFNKKQMYNCI